MSHRKISRLLEDYAEESISSEAVVSEVEQHLQVCLRCQDELSTIRLTRNILRSARLLEAPVPAPGFAPSVLLSVQQQEFQSSWWPLRLAALRAIPVMLLLALFLGLLAYHQVLHLEQSVNARQPMSETFADLPTGWSQDLTVFSDAVSQDRERVVKVLMESQPTSPDAERDNP